MSHIYGNKGVFRVEFPGPPNNSTAPCPGPNYIVQGKSFNWSLQLMSLHTNYGLIQDYNHDWAIVRTHNFTEFFLLSRQQVVSNADVDVSLQLQRRINPKGN